MPERALPCDESRHAREDELREWCSRELDIDSYDGMRGASQRVAQKAASLGMNVPVHWEQQELPHPSGLPYGGGTRPNLVIEARGQVERAERG